MPPVDLGPAGSTPGRAARIATSIAFVLGGAEAFSRKRSVYTRVGPWAQRGADATRATMSVAEITTNQGSVRVIQGAIMPSRKHIPSQAQARRFEAKAARFRVFFAPGVPRSPTRQDSHVTQRQIATRRPFRATRRPFRATRRPFLATRRPFRATRRPFRATRDARDPERSLQEQLVGGSSRAGAGNTPSRRSGKVQSACSTTSTTCASAHASR